MRLTPDQSASASPDRRTPDSSLSYVTSRNIDNIFGPPSECIDIAAFISAAHAIAGKPFQPQPTIREDAAKDFDVADMQATLTETWDNPLLSAWITKDHDNTLSTLQSMSQTNKSRRKIRLPDPHTLAPEVATLQSNLDNTKLSSWKLDMSVVPFIRTPKLSDHNVLTQPRTSTSGPIVDSPQAEIVISIYNRVPYSPGSVSRASQHAFLSCQSLKDVLDSMKCPYTNLPQNSMDESSTQGQSERELGCFILVEGYVYGDGEPRSDYASKLLTHLEKVTRSKTSGSIQKAATTIEKTKFLSLSLRINQPYWLVHQGNCEHFLVVDQISLYRDSVPSHAYPLTLHITPQLVDLCRACAKVPAVWSIVGDVRLGESPCPMCGPCWRNMGESSEEGVKVYRLPDY